MPITVFPNLKFKPPVRHSLRMANVVVDLGDGYEIRANKNQAYARADGLGGTTNPYKGRNRFAISLDPIAYANSDPTQPVNQLWAFYQARFAGFESFYFYNPAERTPPDATGVDIIGRYLVRFEEHNLEREQFVFKLFRTSLSLIEVRA